MKNYCGFYVIMDCKGARGGKRNQSRDSKSKNDDYKGNSKFTHFSHQPHSFPLDIGKYWEKLGH